MQSVQVQKDELEGFFRQRQKPLFRYINYLVQDSDIAADVLQVACLRFVEQVKKGNVLRNTAVSYIYRIARNEAYASFREKRNRTLAGAASIDEYLENNEVKGSEGGWPDRQFELRSLFVEVLENSSLDKITKSILYMRFLELYSVDMIAEKIQKSRSSVYRLSEDGIRHVADSFRDAGYELADFD